MPTKSTEFSAERVQQFQAIKILEVIKIVDGGTFDLRVDMMSAVRKWSGLG